jgi:hypothetical protein
MTSLHASGRNFSAAAKQRKSTPLVGCHLSSSRSTRIVVPLTNSVGTVAFSGLAHSAKRAVPASRRCVSARATAAGKPWKTKNCRLALEDGSVWWGTAFGATGTEIGEVCVP